MKQTVISIVLLTLAVLSNGCMRLSLQKPPVEKQYYIIETQDFEALDTNGGTNQRILSVRKTRMTEAFADANLVYKTGKVEWQSDYYNLFFVSPQSMITDIVRDALAQSGIFSQVMTNRSLMAPTHFLESAVTDLYGDYSNKKAPAAVVKMEFLLLDDTGGTPSIVMKKNYKSRIALSEASPEELVAGFGKGMTEILTQLQRDIHDILKGKN